MRAPDTAWPNLASIGRLSNCRDTPGARRERALGLGWEGQKEERRGVKGERHKEIDMERKRHKRE